jgi:hypothetical protein
MKIATWILVLVTLGLWACKDMTPEQKQKAVTDGIVCGTAVTTSIMQCVLACKPDPKSAGCKDTCVTAFLSSTGSAKVCTDAFGADFIKNPQIVTAINKGYELAIAIYEATKPPPAPPAPAPDAPANPDAPTSMDGGIEVGPVAIGVTFKKYEMFLG